MDWFSNRYYRNMETTLKDRFLEYFAFFLVPKYNLSLCPSYGLPASCLTLDTPLHGAEDLQPLPASHISASFLLLPCFCHSTQATQQPPTPFFWTATVPWNLMAIDLSLVPFSFPSDCSWAQPSEKPVCPPWSWHSGKAAPQLWGKETSNPGVKGGVR